VRRVSPVALLSPPSQRSPNTKVIVMDLNVRAFRTVQAALEEPSSPDPRKEASRKGGIAGGKSRARALSKSRRKEIALAGSSARWGHNAPAKNSQGKERQ